MFIYFSWVGGWGGKDVISTHTRKMCHRPRDPRIIQEVCKLGGHIEFGMCMTKFIKSPRSNRPFFIKFRLVYNYF